MIQKYRKMRRRKRNFTAALDELTWNKEDENEKSKKEKKKLLASQSEEGYLTTLKKGTEMTLKLHQNPYMVFASSIMERFEYTHIEELKPKVTQFMDNYYLDFARFRWNYVPFWADECFW